MPGALLYLHWRAVASCKVHSTGDLALTAILIRKINGVVAPLGIRSGLRQSKCDCYRSHLYPRKAAKWMKRKDKRSREITRANCTRCERAQRSIIRHGPSAVVERTCKSGKIVRLENSRGKHRGTWKKIFS